MKKTEEYLTTKEVAEFIGRSPGAIRNMVMRRSIPYRKPKRCGRLVFVKSEIVKWIESGPGLRVGDLQSEAKKNSLFSWLRASRGGRKLCN